MCVSMYLCTYLCIYIRVHTSPCIYVSMYVYLGTYLCTGTYSNGETFPESSRNFPGIFPQVSRDFPGMFPEPSWNFPGIIEGSRISSQNPGNLSDSSPTGKPSRHFPEFSFSQVPGSTGACAGAPAPSVIVTHLYGALIAQAHRDRTFRNHRSPLYTPLTRLYTPLTPLYTRSPQGRSMYARMPY